MFIVCYNNNNALFCQLTIIIRGNNEFNFESVSYTHLDVYKRQTKVFM